MLQLEIRWQAKTFNGIWLFHHSLESSISSICATSKQRSNEWRFSLLILFVRAHFVCVCVFVVSMTQWPLSHCITNEIYSHRIRVSHFYAENVTIYCFSILQFANFTLYFIDHMNRTRMFFLVSKCINCSNENIVHYLNILVKIHYYTFKVHLIKSLKFERLIFVNLSFLILIQFSRKMCNFCRTFQ